LKTLIGDVIGKPGLKTVKELLPELRRELGCEFVIANGENLAGGAGLTPPTAQELLDAGVDVITTGNHVWAQKDILPALDTDFPVIRPANYPPGAPGRGYIVTPRAIVINLLGRVFIGNYDCPFRVADQVLEQLSNHHLPIFVDFHAEATSEKVALGRYLDGRVSAVVGTHTHVGTIDAQLLPRGTAYVTDLGMVGPMNSVIGNEVESVIQSFLTRLPHRISIGDGRNTFNAVLVQTGPDGKATHIERVVRETE
jgi:metallophosphoesterase (TIGR00282 family)